MDRDEDKNIGKKYRCKKLHTLQLRHSLTFFNSGPLSINSPLKAELVLKMDLKTVKKISRGKQHHHPLSLRV